MADGVSLFQFVFSVERQSNWFFVELVLWVWNPVGRGGLQSLAGDGGVAADVRVCALSCACCQKARLNLKLHRRERFRRCRLLRLFCNFSGCPFHSWTECWQFLMFLCRSFVSGFLVLLLLRMLLFFELSQLLHDEERILPNDRVVCRKSLNLLLILLHAIDDRPFFGEPFLLHLEHVLSSTQKATKNIGL